MQNNPEIEQIVDSAVKLARDLHHEYVMTEHVLLALIRHEPFRRVLQKFGTDVDLLDVHSVSTVTPSVGALGTLTASVTTDTTNSGTGGVVTWNYSVSASAVEYLQKDETKVETFSFNVR